MGTLAARSLASSGQDKAARPHWLRHAGQGGTWARSRQASLALGFAEGEAKGTRQGPLLLSSTMDRDSQPVVVVACKVLAAALERLLPEGLAAEVRLLEYGLHRVPVKLTGALQETLDEIEQPSLVVLGYGLCGNGLKDIRSGQHTLLVPRADDCIAILLGSYRAYMRQFAAVPGTYYLTKGWLESGSHPLKEYQEYLPKYGQEQTLWLLDQQYQHYSRIALVASTLEEMAVYREQAQEVARFCERWGMHYEEILGSDDYVSRLIETAIALRDGTIRPECCSSSGMIDAGSDFLVIPPGGQIRQDMFMR